MQTRVGIVGLPNVGKSSLFKALTAEKIEIANYPFTTIDPNIGVVTVPDERLYKLAEMSHSKKTVPAAIEFYDIAGLVKNAHQGEGLGNKFLSHIREVNLICEVVRVFETKDIIHVEGAPNPLRDIEIINLELILADLQTIEKILHNTHKQAKSGNKDAKARVEVLEKMQRWLNANKLAHTLHLNEQEKELIKDIQLISAKPFIFLLNVDEKNITDETLCKKLITDIASQSGFPEKSFLAISNKFEADVAELTQQEKEELLQSPNASLLPRLIRKAYDTLGLITFFTTGEDESRAWTIIKGSSAPQAGRAIHSDFEKKFIRAEIIPWDILLELNGWPRAREAGKLQLVGKDYIVKDGDVIEFKI